MANLVWLRAVCLPYLASVAMSLKSLWTLAPFRQLGMPGTSVYSPAASGMVFRAQPLGGEAAFLWEYYLSLEQLEPGQGESEIRKSPAPWQGSGW